MSTSTAATRAFPRKRTSPRRPLPPRLAPVVAALGLPLAIHAEDPTVLAAFRRPLLTYDDLLESRPPEAEAVAVSAAATVARESGAHLHIAHLSSALGLQAAEDAVKA